MKVLILGNGSYLQELTDLANNAGYDTFSVEYRFGLFRGEDHEFHDPANEADLAIDCTLHRGGTDLLSQYIRELAPILSLTIAHSVAHFYPYQSANHLFDDGLVGWSAFPPIASPEGEGIVEVARGLQTEGWAFEAAVDFWKSVGLEPVEVADGPGLVRARVLCCLINEAVSALADGVAIAADIDAAMQLGNNFPKGLLAWADELGLDLVLSVLEGIHGETGDPAYRPHPLLKRKVWAGQLGTVSGRGFYEYDAGK